MISPLYIKFFYLERYFVLYFDSVFNRFINGFLIKSNKIFLFIEFFNLHFLVGFSKFNIIIKFTSLMDIVVVDYPSRINYRFELVYSF